MAGIRIVTGQAVSVLQPWTEAGRGGGTRRLVSFLAFAKPQGRRVAEVETVPQRLKPQCNATLAARLKPCP